VDEPLVNAYLARRALDYLVGFNLSPVLWRKLPGAKSAGRVQSVSLRLIVEREMEIEAFRPQEYWSVTARLATPRGQEFDARLTHFAGRKLEKFDLGDATSAELAAQARKFGFGARQTMSLAQRLYEAGYITYMRTDGIDMAPEAVMAARDEIKARYGEDYVPRSPRMYKNKARNAQEAHECIRPTDMSLDAGKLARLEPSARSPARWRPRASSEPRWISPAAMSRCACAPPARWCCLMVS